MDNEKKRRIVIIAAVILGILGLTYLGGMIGQFMDHYKTWLGAGGVGGNTEMKSVNFSPLACIPQAFTINGLKGILGIILAAAGIFLYVRFHDKFDGKIVTAQMSKARKYLRKIPELNDLYFAGDAV